VEIVVSDTGIGIPEEHQQRVFEEFHQVPGPLQQVSGGTGLGLPYASRLAQLLGGTLGLTSEPGRGTRVALRLPLTEHAGEGSPGSPPRFGSVLIVEDDPGMRRVLRGSIAPHAGQVTEAEDGGAALRALRDACPDLVLLDLNIPPPDGRALLAMMREDPRLRDVPIVVVTSAALDRAELARLNSLAVVLDKSRLSADQLIGAAAGASRLVGETT
jgi:CheY-like chemotaxis protein